MSAPICLCCGKPVESGDGVCPDCGEGSPIERYINDCQAVKDKRARERCWLEEAMKRKPCLGCGESPCVCHEGSETCE